jgi:hypothetical protein
LFSFALSSGKLIPYLICLLNLLFVLLITLFVAGWIYKLISAHASALKFEAFLKKNLSLSLSLFWGHLNSLARQNSVLNFFLPFLNYLLSFGVAEIEHSKGIADHIFLYFVVEAAVSSKAG